MVCIFQMTFIELFKYFQNVETRSLEDFLNIAQEKIDRLIKDAKLAQESFNQCVEYFGKKNPFHRMRLILFFKVKHHVHKIHQIFSLFLLNFNELIKFDCSPIKIIFYKIIFLLQQARIDNEERTRLAREAASTIDKPINKRPLNKRSQVS